jgi:hypothetical protein
LFAALILVFTLVAGSPPALAAAPPPPSSRDNPPAQGAPYNYRHMAMAGGIMVVMGGFVVWLVRRTRR